MVSDLDHKAVRWEVIEEDGAYKIRLEHASVDAAQVRIGAAKPFAAFSFTVPNAKELAQRMVDLHNAELEKK